MTLFHPNGLVNSLLMHGTKVSKYYIYTIMKVKECIGDGGGGGGDDAPVLPVPTTKQQRAFAQ